MVWDMKHTDTWAWPALYINFKQRTHVMERLKYVG